MRNRLFESHAYHHSGAGSADAARIIYRRDIHPLLPPPSAGPPLWKPVSGVLKLVLTVEAGVVRGPIVTQNLTFAAVRPQDGSRRIPAAVSATDR